MDRASDLWPEVVGSNLSSGRNCPQLRWDPWARHRTPKSSRYPSLPQVTLATCSRSYQIQGIDVCLQDNNWHCTNMPKLANTNLYALQKLAFCKWTTPCGAIPNRYQITLTAQLVEWPPDLNLNSWVFTRFQKTTKDKYFLAAPDQLILTLTYSILLYHKKNLGTCTVLD